MTVTNAKPAGKLVQGKKTAQEVTIGAKTLIRPEPEALQDSKLNGEPSCNGSWRDLNSNHG